MAAHTGDWRAFFFFLGLEVSRARLHASARPWVPVGLPARTVGPWIWWWVVVVWALFSVTEEVWEVWVLRLPR